MTRPEKKTTLQIAGRIVRAFARLIAALFVGARNGIGHARYIKRVQRVR